MARYNKEQLAKKNAEIARLEKQQRQEAVNNYGPRLGGAFASYLERQGKPQSQLNTLRTALAQAITDNIETGTHQERVAGIDALLRLTETLKRPIIIENYEDGFIGDAHTEVKQRQFGDSENELGTRTVISTKKDGTVGEQG